MRERDALFGASKSSKNERRRLLNELFVLFEDNDADAEIAHLKAEDEGF